MPSPQEQAKEILGERRFQEPDLPRPLERPLDWLGDRVTDAGDWLTRRFDDVDAGLPGGDWVVWLVLAVAVGVIAAAFTRTAIRRRAVTTALARRAEAGPAADPAALEREADAAERSGDFERAVRLRFEAGALRLRMETRTTAEIAAEVGSPQFASLGAEFDAIAYGGRPADAEDASAAREGWAAVLEESRR